MLNEKLKDFNIILASGSPRRHQFLKDLNIDNDGIAIEINYSVIPKSQYEDTIIKNNDKMEIVQFIGGG